MYSNKKLKYLDNNEKVTYLKQKFNKKIKMIKKITISKKSLRLIKMSNTIVNIFVKDIRNVLNIK